VNVNKVIAVGRLGADPEVRYTSAGTAVSTFSIAVDKTWNDKNTGEKQKRTEWIRCVAWGRLGEVCGEHLKKGKEVYVEGELQTRSYDDRDGVKRYSTEVVISTMQFGADPGGNRPPGPTDQDDPMGGEPRGKPAGKKEPEDDDIPF
jgi:single-strand DNA-binding protein